MVNRDEEIIRDIEANPVIMAVKDEKKLELAMEQKSGVIFLLKSNLSSLQENVEEIHAHGKHVIVHVDLVDGLLANEEGVNFIANYTKVDGIISTKPKIVRYAHSLGFFTVLRQFMLDSMAYENLNKNIAMSDPSMVEILPGVAPKILKKITQEAEIPILAGGLIADKEDAMNALAAGAVAISTSHVDLWQM